MEKSLADTDAAEKSAIASFEGLASAKTKEIQAATDAVESKTQRHGEMGVEIVNMKEDLDDTQKALAADKKFLKDLEKNCDTKQAEWEERSKTRSEELLALADTIKILNDDDALELFKKTLPSPTASFMQVGVSAESMRAKALALVRKAA